MNFRFAQQIKDPAKRSFLRQQALANLEEANEQIALLQRAYKLAPDALDWNMRFSSAGFRLNMQRADALSQLKRLDEADQTRRQRWAVVAEGWLAVIATWVIWIYGVGGAIAMCLAAPLGAVLLHLAKALVIAFAGFVVGQKLLKLLARSRR